MSRVVKVYGPAYLDRVLRVDVPLRRGGGPPLDQSVSGRWEFGEGLILVDAAGDTLELSLPGDWSGPSGRVELAEALGFDSGPPVRVVTTHDVLGGMGAGLAAALGGELTSAVGGEADPLSREVEALLRREGVAHRLRRVPERSADWTLMLSSGEHGDKLGVGLRGCHENLLTLGMAAEEVCDARVVAALPNRLAEEALRVPGAAIRMFAPTYRNVDDRGCPVSRLVRWVDILCCNRQEWERLADREQVAWQVSILVITDGPAGALVRYTTPEGEAGRIQVPAFPRDRPPRDTTRAGEAFAAELMATLLDAGWRPGAIEPGLTRRAVERASAAAGLVLDRLGFGFPSREEVDRTLEIGRIG